MIYRVQSVTKVYQESKFLQLSAQKKKREVVALKDITFDVIPGEFLSIVGASGEGKSTLLHILGGLDRPTEGAIYFEERPLKKENLVAMRRKEVGFVFQMFHLLPYKSALDNVALGLTISGSSKRRARREAMKWLKVLGLEDRSKHRPSALSGGENQRVAIARAMVKQPKVLLADEPTGNLDKKSRSEVLNEIKKLNGDHGVTVIMVTHNETDARFYSDRIALIDGRTVSKIGSPNEVLGD